MHFYDRFKDSWSDVDMADENGTSISGLPWGNHTIQLRDRQNVDAMRLTLSGEEPALAAVLGSFTFNATFTHTATEVPLPPKTCLSAAACLSAAHISLCVVRRGPGLTDCSCA